MDIDVSEKYLPVFEALASKVRIQIIHILNEKSMNIKELAEALNLSSAIMTMHIRKLEKSGIVHCEMVPSKGAARKMCSLHLDEIRIEFPTQQKKTRESHITEVSIGLYTDFEIVPTCGICTRENVIGVFDDPRYFLDPERVNAKILWFGKGFVEYKIPNYLLASEMPNELEISLELGSEAPFANSNWPSDITFFLNDVNLGTWTSPGDFAGSKGKLNPDWWFEVVNQYGLLKRLRVTEDGTFMDGLQLSDVKLKDLNLRQQQWRFRIAVLDDAEHIGGVTLFGSGFGNYNQDILFKLFYHKISSPEQRTE
ncbi:transcriptional regulator [Paenibacillus selenitireducens]|uniref:Transcriptional regulator n=1 Tax=Paenibacillus selenitireducens TaxID=1324314 RepID=A0A1T2XLA2_9BACL|nr:ArsR family transcriptional regulator [Paenibacillus selenitireducens]OPA80506.1 transcriptional regulator [Paenibacillus selenitireducens]